MIKTKTILEIGKQYNMLTVLEFAGKKNYRPTYLCRCTCGQEKVAYAKDIASGKVQSCGCLKLMVGSAHRAYPYKNYEGLKFAKLTVLERIYDAPGCRATLLCLCDCGAFKTVSADHLRSGDTKSCGCMLKAAQTRFAEKQKNRRKNHGSCGAAI